MNYYNEVKHLLKCSGIKYELISGNRFEIFLGSNVLTVSENSINGKEIGFENVINTIGKIIEILYKQEQELDFFVACLNSNTLEQ